MMGVYDKNTPKCVKISAECKFNNNYTKLAKKKQGKSVQASNDRGISF